MPTGKQTTCPQAARLLVTPPDDFVPATFPTRVALQRRHHRRHRGTGGQLGTPVIGPSLKRWQDAPGFALASAQVPPAHPATGLHQ